MGKRFSHKLMRRDELIDILRRSKTALLEVDPGLARNLGIMRKAFVAIYGADAENVFRGLAREAGYEDSALTTPAAMAVQSVKAIEQITTPRRKRK